MPFSSLTFSIFDLSHFDFHFLLLRSFNTIDGSFNAINTILGKLELESKAVSEQNFTLNFLEFDIESNSISFFLDYHPILLVDRNECSTVAHGDVCVHVSLRASLSFRSCSHSLPFYLTPRYQLPLFEKICLR